MTFKERIQAAQNELTKLRKSKAKTIVVRNGNHVVTYVRSVT